MERVRGVEPLSSAWKAEVIPLYHTRLYTVDCKLEFLFCQGNFIKFLLIIQTVYLFIMGLFLGGDFV